ncbi:sugar ABC transporter permease [Arthrobacter sp.]|uniref:carbohydrate ABC transporter permease n=1 Tax=Arthrobacter sp. TaxID=1667 RepID=UPI0028120DF9|nr:sugar ABC transporter permease [Arthrobacter sp.]
MTTHAPTRDRIPTADPPPRNKRRRFSWTPYLFIGLAVLYLVLFAVVPLLKGLDLSFTDTRLLNPTGGTYIGFENYERLLGSGAFFKSVLTTLVYTAFTVVASLTLGTISAFVINRKFPGRTLARAVMVMPWAVPTVAVVLVFRWIYNDSSGVANAATTALGLGERGWLTDPDYGMFSVVVATVWKVTPFVMLVVLAALQSVPEDLYEATRVDGAGSYSTFKLVVLPFLMPTLRVVGLLMTIWSFRRFEIIWLLTGGGPVDATTTIVIDVYRQAFNNSQLGVAAAIGMLGLVLSLIVTAIYFVLELRANKQNGANA